MNIYSLLLILLFNCLILSSCSIFNNKNQTSTAEANKLTNFIEAVKKNDENKISNLVKYPLNREYWKSTSKPPITFTLQNRQINGTLSESLTEKEMSAKLYFKTNLPENCQVKIEVGSLMNTTRSEFNYYYETNSEVKNQSLEVLLPTKNTWMGSYIGFCILQEQKDAALLQKLTESFILENGYAKMLKEAGAKPKVECFYYENLQTDYKWISEDAVEWKLTKLNP